MKKITALILAIILCFTLAIPALGSEMSVNGQAYAIVMSGCRAISSNVEVATQPVVETPLAEHIGKMRQGSFINDAEEFVYNHNEI